MPKSLDDSELDDIAKDDEDFGEGLEASEETPETSEVEVTEEAVADDPPEEEVESISVKSLAEKYGLELGDSEDDVESLDQFFGKVSKLNEWAVRAQEQQRAYEQQLQHYQYQLAQRAQQQTQTPPTPAPLTGLLKHWEKVPEWDENWSKLVHRDGDGNLVAIPGADPTLPQKYMQRLEWEERAQRTFFENPRQFMLEALQGTPDLQAFLQQEIQQHIAQVEDKFEADRLAREVAPYIFNENRQLNQAGQVYAASVQEATRAGIRGAQAQHNYAIRAAWPYIEAMKNQQAEPPAETKKKRQLDFAKKQAQKKPNRASETNRAKASRPKDAVDLERAMLAGLVEAGADLDARGVI